MAIPKEFYFSWTCPTCGAKQTDSVNGEDGPFFNLTCEPCGGGFSEDELSEVDADAWEQALQQAEEQAGVSN